MQTSKLSVSAERSLKWCRQILIVKPELRQTDSYHVFQRDPKRERGDHVMAGTGCGRNHVWVPHAELGQAHALIG
jgi:hypothetical protein